MYEYSICRELVENNSARTAQGKPKRRRSMALRLQYECLTENDNVNEYEYCASMSTSY